MKNQFNEMKPSRDNTSSSDSLEDEILRLSIAEVRSELVERGIELTSDADLVSYGIIEDELESDVLSLSHDAVKQQLRGLGVDSCSDDELERISRQIQQRRTPTLDRDSKSTEIDFGAYTGDAQLLAALKKQLCEVSDRHTRSIAEVKEQLRESSLRDQKLTVLKKQLRESSDRHTRSITEIKEQLRESSLRDQELAVLKKQLPVMSLPSTQSIAETVEKIRNFKFAMPASPVPLIIDLDLDLDLKRRTRFNSPMLCSYDFSTVNISSPSSREIFIAMPSVHYSRVLAQLTENGLLAKHQNSDHSQCFSYSITPRGLNSLRCMGCDNQMLKSEWKSEKALIAWLNAGRERIAL